MHLPLLSLLASSGFVLARNLPRAPLLSSRNVETPGWSVQADTCPVEVHLVEYSCWCMLSIKHVLCPTCEFRGCGLLCYCKCMSRNHRSISKMRRRKLELWAGLDGNDFCCEVGFVGAYDHISHRAGTCVKNVVAPTTSAVLKSTGMGEPGTSISITVSSAPITSTVAPTTKSVASSTSIKSSILASSPAKVLSSTVATSIISKASSALGTKAASSTTIAISSSKSTGKPVFFHYMIGGINDDHCEQDIIDAIALGVDAFALNIAVTLDSSHSWAVNTVASLFKHAKTHNFKLFFSFDMTGYTSPSQFIPILNTYITNSAYYTYSGQPFVSTFNGGASTYKFGQSTVNDGWKVAFQEKMAASGHPIYFIPSFQDINPTPSFFTSQFPTLNGTFNWNSWPTYTAGDVPVDTISDKLYQTAAKASKKTFMMGVSPLQFKHISHTENWYRRGEANLERRFAQVLELQPDFIEFQTWNDAGESHYMGNSWVEPLVSNSTPEALSSLGYDHTGYWEILRSFIGVWKAGATNTQTMYPTNGKEAQGTFWHHTLLKDADCSGDKLGLGKPDGIGGVEDSVTAVVLVAKGVKGLKGSISVGGKFWVESIE
ncbi:hypothetical protein DID88_008581 [Monilinia fructigena]|uniref:Glycoside hydrolase family 71 protein n=1 Tax=Monilinia fructigena TaxID=38457 RepID=A0A395J5S0_9HELO|nr:hypothetical protein DID88_008581 [Monilinia fructigena]